MTDFDTLVQEVGSREPLHSRLVAYYEGRQPLTYLSREAREDLDDRLDVLSVNIPRLLVDSIAERLRITGFTDPRVWGHWQANNMISQAATAHIETLLLGECFVAVWARDGRPLVTVESATQIACDLDPATGAVRAAVKRWETPEGSQAVWYGADEIVRYRADHTGAMAGFKPVERIDNPMGRVPLVRFRNGDRLTHRGISEMLDVIPLTDALVKLVTDMLTASEYAARPRRWATGLEVTEDRDGNPISPIPEGERMMVGESPDIKFGQLPGADLAGYQTAINTTVRLISAVTGLPEHLLGIGGDNPTSADSIRASEAALTAKAEARQRQFGRSWTEVTQLVLAASTGLAPGSFDVAPVWADAATRSTAQEADAVTKLVQAGILPVTYALKRLGYTDAEITEISAARRADALNNAAIQLAAS